MTKTNPLTASSPEELLRRFDAAGIRRYKIGAFDIDGVLRGKYVNRQKLESALNKGFGFCDVVFGWDSGDRLYEGAKVSGWHTGYRDAEAVLIEQTARPLVIEPDTALVLAEFRGSYESVCPRSVLRRVVNKASQMGFEVRGAAEYEFFVFEETPESVREKNYQGLKPITPGMFGYSMLRSGVHHEFYHELLNTMEGLDCAIEGLHTETGPGVIEAALAHDHVLQAADKAALFKTFTKVLAQRRGWMATFMAKWSNDYPGQSGHLHLSLEKEGVNQFYGPNQGMSPLFSQFIAGQVHYLPEVLPMVCSTLNAYRRLVPGMWAPTHANYGIENRTAAIRAIVGSEAGTRSEYRIGPADANPYLAFAAALATGLRGIEEKLELPDAVIENGYENPGSKSKALPTQLRAATEAFEKSAVTRELFGDTFVEHYAITRREECDQFERAVTDFELRRYFEII